MDTKYPEFGAEMRNIRLGLAADEFNPYRSMNISHSTWPVVQVNYNLPPWLIMKQENLIVSRNWFNGGLFDNERSSENSTKGKKPKWMMVVRQFTPEETQIPTGKHTRSTLMNAVYTRRDDEKKIIKLNTELQAVADDDKVLSEFKVTLSRQSVPLDCIIWHRSPQQQKEELWSFVKTKYEIPEEGKTYTLWTIGAAWRQHKSQERAKKNAENRKLIVETRTAGRKSFAQIGEKIKAEKKIEPEKLAPKDDIFM